MTQGPQRSRSAKNLAPYVDGRPLGRVDEDVSAEVPRQFASLGMNVRDDDRLDSPAGECGHRRETDRARADDDRYLARRHPGGTDVELTDREGVDECHGIAGDVALDGSGQCLGNHHQFAEAALGFGVLTNDSRAVGTAVDQPDRNRRDSTAQRDRLRATGPVPDDLADELVPEHDVAIRVVQGTTGGVVDRQFGMVHEVDVRRADRGTERLQQQLAVTGHRVGRLPDRQLAVSQHDCTHPDQPFACIYRIFEKYCRNIDI
jgi:hypothetical protein